MRSKILCLMFLFSQTILIAPISAHFIVNHENLKEYKDNPGTIVVASTGRSGSSLLTGAIIQAVANQAILKTHLLPPNYDFKGKFIFIFSDPNKAAESALHQILSNKLWGPLHFRNMENSDHDWLELTNQANNQTIKSNLLAHDALRCFEHLNAWLHVRTEPSTREEAQVLALKYENLWESDSINAINEFLNIDNLSLPPRRDRGLKIDNLSPLERRIRTVYNLGTYQNPRYKAYDNAREVWNAAPPYQFLKFANQN